MVNVTHQAGHNPRESGDQRAQSPLRSATADGFSILELHRAGISERRAHALGIPIDGRRHSALRHNIVHLKGFAG